MTNSLRTLASVTFGILLAAAAALAAGGLDHFGLLMILIGAAAAPVVRITGSVLTGIIGRLRRTRGILDLLRRVAASAVELLSLLVLCWILLGVAALAVDPVMAIPALAGGTGLALGCFIGAGRGEAPIRPIIHGDRTGPPFFREPRVNA
jgi:hypothetical protein